VTFESDGYLVVKNFLGGCGDLYRYTLENQHPVNIQERQVPNTPSYYNDKRMSKIHEDILPEVEKVVGLKLLKTYCYYRKYKLGDILKSHVDREACELSVTINIGGSDEWPIWILTYQEEAKEIILHQGDAMFYRGFDLRHWRGINRKAFDYSQLFLHYVDKDGPYAWAKDDILLADGDDSAQGGGGS